MDIKEYFGNWLKVIDPKIFYTSLVTINEIYAQKKVCPNQVDVFKAFRLCKYEDCRIVFLGQDPYPQYNVATGILFGNNSSVSEKNWSPSLKIVKDSLLSNSISYKSINFDPTLENWAKQGILMLNSALTVEVNKVGSHSLIWRPFISKLLYNLSINNPSIIYVLFGSTAASFTPYITKCSHIFKVKHPAYYARIGRQMPNIFMEVNILLKQINGDTINWYGE